jgi:hypothetical protein
MAAAFIPAFNLTFMCGFSVKFGMSLLLVLLFCGFVDSQAQGIAAQNCVKKCCVAAGGTFDVGCDFGGAQPSEKFGDCLSECMDESRGAEEMVSSSAPKEIPEAAKTCLKGCCEQIGGKFDQKSSYCDTTYEASATEGFQSCQMRCVGQNLQPKPGVASELAGAAGAGQGSGGSTCCLPFLSGAVALLGAALGAKIM